MAHNSYEQDDDRAAFLALQLRNGWGRGEVELIQPTEVHGGILSKEELVNRTMASEQYWQRIKKDLLKMLVRGGAQIRDGE